MNLEEFLKMECDRDELIDYRALDYVSTYDAHLMCPICHCPFIRPLRLQCDHVFCQKCLNTAITSFGASRDDFKCPTCRAPTSDVFMNVPRLLINMCDDIRVRCPFTSEGCSEIVPRGHIQSHVDKYCAYKLVDCPDHSCDQKTRKMHLHPENKCMHELHQCSRCEEEVMEQDYEEHVKELCPSLKTTCPDCQATVFRRALREHIDTCPEAILYCAASKYGCPVKVKRADLATHEQTCPLISMGPYFEAQNSRLDSLELTIRHLQQRNEIFEDGLANIRSSLVDASRTVPGLSSQQPQPQTNPAASSSSPEIPPNALHHPASETPSTPTSNAATTTYLLALHESLREEVGQLSHAITDLDARASMAIMNECLRIKEDMAHTNAAVASVRMQVQWLMNPRFHQARNLAANASVNTAAGPSNSNTNGNGSGNVNTVLRPRRVSDSGREGTKL